MKIVNMHSYAILVLCFLAAAAKALNCSPPPVPADQAWIDSINSGSDSGCTVVNGDLHLGWKCTAYDTCSGDQPTLKGSVNLGAVETITGQLTCWANPNIKTVTADNLANAGALVISYKMDLAFTYNTLLTGFSFPALLTVSGEVNIYRNYNLTSIGLGALLTIGGRLYIYSNYALTSIGLGALQTIGGRLSVGDNAVLYSMDLGALKTIKGRLYIRFNKNPLTIEVIENSPLQGCQDLRALNACYGVKLTLDDICITPLCVLQKIMHNLISHPTALPTKQPTTQPTALPTKQPTTQPTALPTKQPKTQPTALPTKQPTTQPTALPTKQPTTQPTAPAPAPAPAPDGDKYYKLDKTRVRGKRLSKSPRMSSSDLEKCKEWCDENNRCTGFHVRAGQCIFKGSTESRPNMADSTAYVKKELYTSGGFTSRLLESEDTDDSDDSDDSQNEVNPAPRATGPTGAGAVLLLLLPFLY